MTIFYEYSNGLYVNITNDCPCSCDFCIRNSTDKVGSSDSLWLEKEPTFEEAIAELNKFDLKNYKEVVFCGYGEPLERVSLIVDLCTYIRKISNIKIRINTNGLGDLINGRSVAKEFKGLVDVMSISLNAPDKDEYFQICHPAFGIKSFDAMLSFTKDCKNYIDEVVLSVVSILGEEKINRCKELANELGVKLRVREMM